MPETSPPAASRAGAGGTLEADYRAVRGAVGAWWLPRDFLRVRGRDAFTFLQGQLSQDVDLAPVASADALLLQPQGKVVALLRVTRLAEDDFVLDLDGGWSAAVVERLNRFKLRVQAAIEPLDWRCLALRGPDARAVAEGDGVLAAPADWPGLPGADLIGEAPEVPEGVRLCGPEAYEVVRVEAGVPAMGSELDERTIPAEAGVVERSVSFTKGCYTGQELVARIDSRGGHVPRRLRGVVMARPEPVPPSGARVRAGGKEVGWLTSVAPAVGGRPPVALAYVGRALEPPGEVEVGWEGGTGLARVVALPIPAVGG